MASLTERLTGTVSRVRQRFPVIDRVARTVQHYTVVNGNGQAGGVTVFGFLSFFPILGFAFFAVGWISKVYPRARGDLVTVLEQILPGVVGTGEGEIPLETFEQNATGIAIVGLVGVLYAGLGWISALREGLEVMFRLPQGEQPSFVVGKARDLLVLAVIGLTLIVSVGLSAAVAYTSRLILRLVRLEDSVVAAGLLWLLAHGLAIVATTVLLLAMFRLLADPPEPRRALLQGALLGAVGFELLKGAANFLIETTKEQPAFQAFGVALVLIVWIWYFSRLIMYSAAWAYAAPLSLERRAAQYLHMPGAALTARSEEPSVGPVTHTGAAPTRQGARAGRGWLAVTGVAAGAVAAVAAIRRLRDG